MKKFLFLALILFSGLFQLRAEEASPVTCEMLSEQACLTPGATCWFLFKFTIAPSWHLYWYNPGETGAAPQIAMRLPKDFITSDVFWPTPSRIEVGKEVMYGYSNEALLLVPIVAPWGLEVGSTVDLEASVKWVACGTACVPGSTVLKITLPTADKPSLNEAVAPLFASARAALPREDLPYVIRSAAGALQLELGAEPAPFREIDHVVFFPEVQGTLDPHLLPKWQSIQNNTKLVVDLPFTDPKKVQGVLVVTFKEGSLQKNISLLVRPLVVATPVQEAVKGHFSVFLVKLGALFMAIRDFFSSEMGRLMLLAFLGGLLLNIMPCVLPVVSLKLFHFVNLRGASRLTIFKHCASFSFGILFSFWLLAAASFALASLGKIVGWGFQLQEPLFVAPLAILIFIVGLNLFGLFEFGTRVASLAGQLDELMKTDSTLVKAMPSAFASFCSGVLATVIASPCTGPLLGSAIGFTAALEPYSAAVIFTSLGLGMAFPYLLIPIFPKLLSLIPKPGRWMITFRQLMGFFLMATALWLVWVLEAETHALSVMKVLLSLYLIAFGFWIYGTWAGFERRALVRAAAKLLTLIVVLSGALILILEVHEAKERPPCFTVTQENKVPGKEWEPFSLERLGELRHKKIPVFVDFSAKWCLLCQTNKLVLEAPGVKEAFIKYGVVKMEADWTRGDETVTKMLRSLGRNGVPVYALYGKDPTKEPVLLPEIITQETVLDALKELSAR
jgi:thiol:disulfide interchange protein DsbD